MRVCVFASGSTGNCLLISDGNTNILIDAGISMRRMVNSLKQAGLTMHDIGGVLITHEHSDHICGLKMLLKHYALPVYAPRTVAFHLRGILPELEELLHIVPVGEKFSIGSLSVNAFHTSHDTDESVGYKLTGSASFAIATDTGCVNEEIEMALTGSQAVLVESNHDEEMLRYGPYPVYLKRRVLSNRGHLSNECCAALAAQLAAAGTEHIILGHLSRTNNTPAIALETVKKALIGQAAELYCAPELGFLEIRVGEVV